MERDLSKLEKRIKCRILIAFSVIATLFLICIFAFGIYKCQRTFSISKWNTDVENRHYIVSNMLKKYTITGMKESEILELLGQEDSQQTSFKMSRDIFPSESTLVYYMGVDIMDNVWLIISIENGVAVSYCIDVT